METIGILGVSYIVFRVGDFGFGAPEGVTGGSGGIQTFLDLILGKG